MPVAQAKNMGIIAMKVFADGAMYTKDAHWTQGPQEVVRSVGDKKLPSRSLIEYSLSTSGISTGIIGIGEISDDPLKCQLTQNISAAQIKEEVLSSTDRAEVEQLALYAKEGKTNYFQINDSGMKSVQDFKAIRDGKGIKISWNSAFAGNEPIKSYEIFKGSQSIGKVNHTPQITKKEFTFSDTSSKTGDYKVVAIDTKGNKVESELIGV